MKSLIVLVALFGITFANAEDYCHIMPTQEQKEVIYGGLGIPFDVSFEDVCEAYKKTYGLEEVEWGFRKTFLGKITFGTGCALSFLGMWFVPDASDDIDRFRKEKPYSKMKGKDIIYRFGGSEARYYRIRNRDDYDSMIENIRAGLNGKYSAQQNFWGGTSAISCNLAWSVPF